MLENSTSSSKKFMKGVGAFLGVTSAFLEEMKPGIFFSGPTGFLCAVHVKPTLKPVCGFAEVLIPMSARELGGESVARLLEMQDFLLQEYAWRLGISVQGLLSVYPMLSEASPERVASQLELGQRLAHSVIAYLNATS